MPLISPDLMPHCASPRTPFGRLMLSRQPMLPFSPLYVIDIDISRCAILRRYADFHDDYATAAHDAMMPLIQRGRQLILAPLHFFISSPCCRLRFADLRLLAATLFDAA